MSEKKEKRIVVNVIQDKDKAFTALPADRHYTGIGSVKKEATVPKQRTELSSGEYAMWGEDDCLPNNFLEKINRVPMAAQAIYKLVAMMYGNGLAYYKNSDLQDGNQVKRANIPKVEEWLTRNRIRTKYIIPQLVDYRYFVNTFSEFVLSNDRTICTGLFHKQAVFSRLSKQDEKTLRSKHLYYSVDFKQGQQPTQARRATLSLFDWTQEKKWVEKNRNERFAYHAYMETPGMEYYADAFWLQLGRRDGWLDASASAVEVVNAMMRNQVSLKYQILIPESYFVIRHQDWQSYTDKKRNDLIDDLIKQINETLSGTKNVMKSITTIFKQDQVTGTALGKIEIIPIDDKTKNDSWVPSSEKSDAQIVQGLGIHPSQLGLSTSGGKMGAGSGSDQREGFNTAISINTMDQNIVLEALQLAARYNATEGKLDNEIRDKDWDITFFFDHTHHTTTNNKESGLVESDTTITVEE